LAIVARAICVVQKTIARRQDKARDKHRHKGQVWYSLINDDMNERGVSACRLRRWSLGYHHTTRSRPIGATRVVSHKLTCSNTSS
jgi:hypothetical protein